MFYILSLSLHIFYHSRPPKHASTKLDVIKFRGFPKPNFLSFTTWLFKTAIQKHVFEFMCRPKQRCAGSGFSGRSPGGKRVWEKLSSSAITSAVTLPPPSWRPAVPLAASRCPSRCPSRCLPRRRLTNRRKPVTSCLWSSKRQDKDAQTKTQPLTSEAAEMTAVVSNN